jgi:hypothetical protein
VPKHNAVSAILGERELSGTPTTAGTPNFTVTATDSSTGSRPYTGARAYSFVVDPNGAPALSGAGTVPHTET